MALDPNTFAQIYYGFQIRLDTQNDAPAISIMETRIAYSFVYRGALRIVQGQRATTGIISIRGKGETARLSFALRCKVP